MRDKLIALVLLAIVGVAVIALVNFFSKPPALAGDPSLSTDGRSADVSETLPGTGRDPISSNEAAPAIARKLLPPGTKSLINVAAQLRHSDYVWNDEGVAAGPLIIWVDLRRQMISAFRNGHEIGTAVIVYGAKDMASPEGSFQILSKISGHHSRTYDVPMPFSLFITNDGVALHGSPMSERRASHGCIGLPVDFAQKLFEASKVGDIVEITRSDTLVAG